MGSGAASHKAKGVDIASFAECLAEARVSLGEAEETVASRVGVDARTIRRWERGEMAPSRSVRQDIADALANVPGELWRDLVASLGLSMAEMLARHPAQAAAASPPPPPAPPPPPPPPAPPAPPAVDARAVLDDAVRNAAEHLDVSPRRVRLVLATLLADVERLGLPVDVARDIVLGRGAPKGSSD